MGREAVWEIVKDHLMGPLIVKDCGPWDKHLTVTNDVENVVLKLVREGRLPPGRRLLYYDSVGHLDEIVVKDGKFVGYKFCPPENFVR